MRRRETSHLETLRLLIRSIAFLVAFQVNQALILPFQMKKSTRKEAGKCLPLALPAFCVVFTAEVPAVAWAHLDAW